MHSLSKLCLALMALCFLFSFAARAQVPSDPRPAIADALSKQEYERALQLLRPALEQFPGNAELWAMQGVAYEKEGNKKEALASFRKSLKIAPDYLPALQGAAEIEFEAGSPAAIPLIRRVLSQRPGDRTGHGMLAVLEYQQGNCSAAVPNFEKAGSLFDSQVSALHAYGVCLVRLKQLDRAAMVFQKALALEPGDPQETRLLASIQLMDHKPKDALATLAPLLQSRQTDPQLLELVSTAYEDAGDTTQAVSTMRQAILLDPSNVNLYLDFAHLAYAHDSYQVGIDALSDGISQQPKAAPLYLARGVLYVQLAQYDKAEADFDKAHELDPRQSLSSAAQSMAAVQQNDFHRALAKVQAKLARKPNDPLLLYLQADFLLQQGAEPGTPEFSLALRSARKAVELQPNLGDARGVLAKIYLQSGHYRQAVEQCRKALEINPKDQTAVYHLIMGLRKTGQTAEIPELLKRLASLREQAAKEQSRRYQYKLVEDETGAKAPKLP